MNGVKSGAVWCATLLVLALAAPIQAQQTIGYVDSEYVLNQMPEYATVQQQLDRQAQEWQNEIEEQQRTVDEMFQEYQARELLYTAEERQRRREEIVRTEDEVERLRMQYFGPEGELFREQERLLRPIQERILEAIEEVASAEGYDYVFDKSGDFVFLFARDQYDVSNLVLQELGIDVNQ